MTTFFPLALGGLVIWLLTKVAEAAAGPGMPDKVTEPARKEEILRVIQLEETKIPTGERPPIPVAQAAWDRWTAAWKQADADAVTTDGRRGVFLIGLPTLVDQGYMRNLRKVSGKPTADWVPPYSQKVFAENLRLQYEIFAEQAKRHRDAVLSKCAPWLSEASPKTIPLADGRALPVTLSGLMAVSRQAGLSGLDKWLHEPSTRKGNTTELFAKFTGIF